MKNRWLCGLLAIFLLLTAPGAQAAGSVEARTSASRLLVDGVEVSCGAYEIAAANGYSNNYFKLRDVAALLNGTPAQFSVGWNGLTGVVSLTAGEPYVPVGGELASLTGSTSAAPAQGAVYVNGRRADLTAYVIGQNNYFKLRDLGEALGFSVEWDGAAGAIRIESDPFVMNVNIASEPQTMDPTLNSAVDGAIMMGHLFEGLMRWENSGTAFEGAENCAQAILIPGQAESYEKRVNADGTVTYTFHLRDGIRWSDGQPVTAGDFVYSWRRLVQPYTAADYCYIIDMVRGYEEVNWYGADPSTLGVSAPDEKTLVVDLSYDCPYFLEVCAFPATYPLRQDVVEAEYSSQSFQNGLDGWTYQVESYLSNGPYQLAEWSHNWRLVMSRNPHYYDRSRQGPDTIIFQLMDNNKTMLAGFNSGKLDFIEDMPVEEIPGLLVSGELKIVPYSGVYYINYNVEAPPFDDWRVRKAFTLAIDSRDIVDNVTQTGQVFASGFVPSGVADAGPHSDFRTVGGDYWTAPDVPAQYEKNVEEARRLLAEAGYPNGEGFPAVTYLYNTSVNHRMIGEALQRQWREALNVEVMLEQQEWAAFLETRRRGDYQLARNGWIADYNDPVTFLDMWVTGGGNNDARYSAKDYDAAIAEAKSTSDSAVRMAAMHRAEDIIIGRDWALGPIYFYTQKYMLQEDITGLYYTPLGYFYFDRCQRK